MDIFGNQEKIKGDKKSRKVKESGGFDYSVFPDSNSKNQDATEKPKSLGWIKVAVALFFVVIAGKLFLSQIVYGNYSKDLAEGNKIRPRVVPATRGLITDKNGVWLARNVPSFDLSLFPSDLPKNEDEREENYKKISEISGKNKDEIKSLAEDSGLLALDSITLIENLSFEDALLYEEKVMGVSGLVVVKKASREYKNTLSLSHILGYTGKVSERDLEENPDYRFSSWIGKTGIESVYEKEIKGQDGVEQVEVDSMGNIIRVLVDENNTEPIAGNEAVLYLDSGLQEKSVEYLLEGMAASKELTQEEPEAGVVIAINPQNGGILSMVSLPSYDNNLFAKGIKPEDYKMLIEDQKKPMFNRATSGTYPPGSIIKIVMAVAGLAEGNINLNTAFDTPLAIEIGEWKYPDWKDHGYTNVEKAIAESNNVFFYAVGGGYENIISGLGINKIKKWWENFGLGSPTGIDLDSEASGLLPDSDWKESYFDEPWYLGDTYNVSIGQGNLLVSPIQMVRAVATIANGGKLMEPQFVQKIVDSHGNVIKEYSPAIANGQVAEPSVIEAVQRGMRKTVLEGSARQLQDLPVSVAGKTGTAQFFGNQKTHAWFECYAPYENPEIAIVVLIEGGGAGNEIAAPIAQKILNYYYTR